MLVTNIGDKSLASLSAISATEAVKERAFKDPGKIMKTQKRNSVGANSIGNHTFDSN